MKHWDALEEAGHDLTHCGMLWAGTHLYYCEDCGAILLTKHEGIELFHLPPGSTSSQERCRGSKPLAQTSLKAKLEALQQADWERLKDI